MITILKTQQLTLSDKIRKEIKVKHKVHRSIFETPWRPGTSFLNF